MSETPLRDASHAPASGHMPDHTPVVAQTAGQRLKAARLQAGVDLMVLSAKLKVPVDKLEALEADQHPSDQSPVFVRALAASVSRQLRLDPAPILALLPQAANYIEPHGAVRHSLITPTAFAQTQRPFVKFGASTRWAAVAMVLLIAALIWLPSPSQWAWVNALSAYLDTGAHNEHTVIAEPQAVLPLPAASDALPLGAVVVVPSQTESSAPATAAQAPVGTPIRPASASDVPGRDALGLGARFEVKP